MRTFAAEIAENAEKSSFPLDAYELLSLSSPRLIL
jgi:hypothetical protein